MSNEMQRYKCIDVSEAKELIKQEVKYPKIVLAQSLLETGDYSCNICSMDANNLFGLRNV